MAIKDWFRKRPSDLGPELPAEPEIAAAAPKNEELPAQDDLMGLEIHAYAKQKGIATESVWKRIRDGELIARTENGFVYVYSQEPATTPSAASWQPMALTQQVSADAGALVLEGALQDQLSVLLQQLEQARHQHRELMEFTHTSIEHMKQMSVELARSKDQVIAAQTEKIDKTVQEAAELKATLERERAQLKKTRQELEDVQMLNRSLSELSP